MLDFVLNRKVQKKNISRAVALASSPLHISFIGMARQSGQCVFALCVAAALRIDGTMETTQSASDCAVGRNHRLDFDCQFNFLAMLRNSVPNNILFFFSIINYITNEL